MSMGTFGTVNVYCDMTTGDGGWIVIQRNRNGSSVSFNRNWREYEDGFGYLTGEFWYWLKAIHILSQNSRWEIRVEFTKENGSSSYIHYKQFKVGSASEPYKLTVGGYTGVDGDNFTEGKQSSNNRMFTILVSTNDLHTAVNCAVITRSGWWFSENCDEINPNRQQPWYDRLNIAINIEIKIRPKNCALE